MIDISSNKYDRQLLIYLLILIIFGIVMLYSASWYESFANSNGKTDKLYLKNHLKRLAIGSLFFLTFLLLDYRKLKIIAPYLIIFTIVLLIITKAYYLLNGFSWYKPSRWLYVGPISIQTSDIARFSIIIFMAYYADKKRVLLKNLYKGLLPAIFILISIMGLIIIQPDYSTAIMIGIIGVTILFIGGAKIRHLSSLSLFGLLIGIPILLSREYRKKRLLSFFGLDDSQDMGYQANQSLIGLGNGGFFGVGLGNSVEKNHFLPTPHTDFIFSIVGEELGFILGTIPVLTLFLLIFIRGLKIAKLSTDPFALLLSVGISFNLILYAFVNAAVVTGLFPVTGLPMPMISYGGSGTIINLAMIGILLNISESKRSLNTGKWNTLIYG